MDSIVVNLGSVDSRRYLRVIVSLEVNNSETEMAITGNKVIFRDKLVSYLSTKDAKTIGTQDSLVKLRSEIKDILNKILGSDNAITQVYFSDFIVQ
jgi:flagellar basal body-associated protein FliL